MKPRRATDSTRRSIGDRKPSAQEQARLQKLKNAVGDAVLAIPEMGFDTLLETPTATVLGHEEPALISPVHLLNRGEVDRPREVMVPAVPQVIAGKMGCSPRLDQQQTRKQFAHWLVRPDNPLTARVIINRIWGWHFGRGIVSTTSDFGRMGEPPSHPELLDWLANEFTSTGWSIKRLHRLIMLSRTYQQSNAFGTEENVAMIRRTAFCGE